MLNPHFQKITLVQVPQSTEITETATYAERETVPIVLPSSFSKLSLLEELNARAWRIVGKIPDDFEKLSSLEFIDLGHNDFSHLPSSLKGLHFLKKLLIPHCKQLKALPPLPSSLLEINAANCGALESIHDISELVFLHELNLANCMSLGDVQGVECLRSLKMLHMVGCNVSCASIVRNKLDKVLFSPICFRKNVFRIFFSCHTKHAISFIQFLAKTVTLMTTVFTLSLL